MWRRATSSRPCSSWRLCCTIPPANKTRSIAPGPEAPSPHIPTRVGEVPPLPAPLQLGGGFQNRGAGLFGLVQNLVDPRLAAHDVVEDDAAEAAALRAQTDAAGQPFAAIEAD